MARLTAILVRSFAFASAAVAIACSPNPPPPLPPASTPPAGVTFSQGKFGGVCYGYIYTQAGVGWAFCDDGKWAYTTSDPSGYEYGYEDLYDGAVPYDGGPPPYEGQGQ